MPDWSMLTVPWRACRTTKGFTAESGAELAQLLASADVVFGRTAIDAGAVHVGAAVAAPATAGAATVIAVTAVAMSNERAEAMVRRRSVCGSNTAGKPSIPR